LHNLARQNPLQVEIVRVNLSGADQDRTDGARLVETLAEAPVSLDEHPGHLDLVVDLPLGIGKLKLPDRDVIGSSITVTRGKQSESALLSMRSPKAVGANPRT
jgi:hypothetical protein